MAVHAFESVSGGMVDLDICFSCQGIWFEPQENLKLTPPALVELFRLLHEHRDEPRQALPQSLLCPHCSRSLTQGFDVVRSGRYTTYRCPQRDGRFSTFSSFMIEKGFVRLLTRPEIDDIARRVAVIHCTACGAPVDLRRDQVCPHWPTRWCNSSVTANRPGAQTRQSAVRPSTGRCRILPCGSWVFPWSGKCCVSPHLGPVRKLHHAQLHPILLVQPVPSR
jgi:hypothetical protein